MGPVLRVVCCFGRSFGPGQLVCGGALGGVGAEMFGAQSVVGGAVLCLIPLRPTFMGLGRAGAARRNCCAAPPWGAEWP